MSIEIDPDVTTSRPPARRGRSTAAKKAAPVKKAAPARGAARKNATEANIATDVAINAAAGEKLLPHAFNLDELEREGAPELPFAFVHEGRQYILADPHELDWQRLLLVINNPVQFLRLALAEPDRDAFFETPMAAWKLRALTEAYQKHYGLGTPGESNGLPV